MFIGVIDYAESNGNNADFCIVKNYVITVDQNVLLPNNSNTRQKYFKDNITIGFSIINYTYKHTLCIFKNDF